MKTFALTLAITSMPVLAYSYSWDQDDQEGTPRTSYEQQRHTYEKHGYDTYRNGPLEETRREEARKQERQREEEQRRQEESRSRSTYDGSHRSLYPR